MRQYSRLNATERQVIEALTCLQHHKHTDTQTDVSMGVNCSARREADLCVASLTLRSVFWRGLLVSCIHVLLFPPTLRGELITRSPLSRYDGTGDPGAPRR